MNHDILKSFISMDQEVFTQIAKHYGYVSAAVYRLLGKNLIYILGSNADEANKWPASASLSFDYTPRRGVGMPVGWTKPLLGPENKKLWPKAISFYYPVQEWSSVKLVFVVRNAQGKRTRLGELDGMFEALGASIAAWIDQGEVRHFVSEAHFLEQMHHLNLEIQYLLDHELRTPLTSIMGYTALLPEADSVQISEYGQIVGSETQRALNSLQRLSQAFQFRGEQTMDQELVSVELGKLCTELCEKLRQQATTLASGPVGDQRLAVTLRNANSQAMQVHGDLALMTSAIWEVLKNAASYALAGHIDLTLYQSDQMLVLDTADDGGGVAPGAEELIFLRFFQGPLVEGNHRVRRGLGLGLYLARCIAEQHGGSLSYVRGIGKHGVFRFMWPRREMMTGEDRVERAS